MKTMQMFVLRSHLMRGVTFSILRYHFDKSLHKTCGLVRQFRSPSHREVHTTTSYCRYNDRSDRRNDGQMSVFRNGNKYVTGQKDESNNDREVNRRQIEVLYEQKVEDQDKADRDYHMGRDHSGYQSGEKYNSNDGQQYNEQREAIQSPENPEADEWKDTFGNMSRDRDLKKTLPKWLQDEKFGKPVELEKPHRRLSVENRRHTQDWYFEQIVRMGKEGKVLEAIAVLDDWMLVRDRVMPNEDIFTAVIGIIGRTGNPTLAFKYFKKMRNYDLKPNNATYTALFNACSNSPDKTIALKKGISLRNYMRRSEVIPNMVTYNAIIKMFGRFGDLPNAFLIADEAMSNRRAADSYFFGSLLSAAISDKEEGLLYAIEVWRRMKIMKFKPDLFHYKLMLHTIKECGLGGEEQQRILLQSYVSHKHPKVKQREYGAMTEVAEQQCYADLTQKGVQHQDQRKIKQRGESQLELHTGNIAGDTAVSLLSEEQADTSMAMITSHEQPYTVAKFPDLLDPRGTFSEVVSLGNMSEGEDRLLLMGGIGGFLRRMRADEVRPDITVLTWLIQMTRGKEDEEVILSELSEGNVDADSTFLNALIRSKAQRESYDDAKVVLQLFTKYKLVPNKQTYGSLMYCTRNPNEARDILHSMENAGLVPDIKTFGLLIGKAAGSFGYKKSLLNKMEYMNIKPNMYFLQTVERQLRNIRNQILLEKHRNMNKKTQVLEEGLVDFNAFYKEWLLKTEMTKEPHQLENYRKKRGLPSGRMRT